MLPIPIISNLNINAPILYQYVKGFDTNPSFDYGGGGASGSYPSNVTVSNITNPNMSYPTEYYIPSPTMVELRARWQINRKGAMAMRFYQLTDSGNTELFFQWYSFNNQVYEMNNLTTVNTYVVPQYYANVVLEMRYDLYTGHWEFWSDGSLLLEGDWKSVETSQYVYARVFEGSATKTTTTLLPL